MIHRICPFSLALVAAGLAVEARAASTALDDYVTEGLRSNIALKERRISWQQSLAALGEARGMFMPSLSLEARYSRAGGGRQITFPAGDMLNPVYGTLNDMLVAQGGQPQFPTIDNEVIPFLREEEHDTKLRASQPLFVPSVLHNYQLKSALVDVEHAQMQAFECQLAADIRVAYYGWRKASDVLEVLDGTRHLLEEKLRVSESLVTQGKATREVVFRARAELAAFEQEQRRAAMGERLTKNHFNFLLNRPLDTDIGIADERDDALVAATEAMDGSLRQELRALDAATVAAEESVDLAWSEYLPTVVAAFDYGFEGEKYRFDTDHDYWMFSVLLSWSLFDGLQDHYGREQAEHYVALVTAQRRELELAIALAVRRAQEELDVARRGIDSAEARVESERQSFALTTKRYELGMAPQVEFLEARDAMTQAEIERVVARHDLAIKRAELLRVLGITGAPSQVSQ
jgi:outer membrane protein TolC